MAGNADDPLQNVTKQPELGTQDYNDILLNVLQSVAPIPPPPAAPRVLSTSTPSAPNADTVPPSTPDKLRPDLLPQDLVVFLGFLGPSTRQDEGFFRIYLTLQFNEYIEFPKTAVVVYRDLNQLGGAPLGAMVFWLKRDTVIQHVRMETINLQRGFLQGGIGTAGGGPFAMPPLSGFPMGGGSNAPWCGGGSNAPWCGGGSNAPWCGGGSNAPWCGGGSNAPWCGGGSGLWCG